MGLRFIYGRAGSGKTRLCLNEMKERIIEGTNKPLFLLVPEQFTFQAERDLINILKTGGIIKTEVLSFRRLAFRVFNQVGGITYPHIHSAGKCMIIYRILDKIKGDLKVFAGAADQQGFVNTLSTLITEFKRYSVTPDVLQSVGAAIDGDNPLKTKLIELASIYDTFEKTLTERYRDSDDDLTIASQKLDCTSLFDNAEIWIDGFAGFTPQEYKIIGKLMSKAERVTISFCTDCLEGEVLPGGLDIFSSIKYSHKKLVMAAKECGIPIEPPIHMGHLPIYRFGDSPELAHLEAYLNSYPYKAYNEKTKDILLFSSMNVFSEIEAAARDIIRLCRDRDMRYKDIAVVTRNLTGYERLIRVIFNEYEIPYFIDSKVDITNHPMVRMILSMLDIFIENWSYEAVFRYLKTGLTQLEQEDIDRLENYVLACGIRGNRWTDGQDWKMRPELMPDEKNSEVQREMLVSINNTRRQVVEPLLKFRSMTKGKRKAADFCGCLYEFLCSLEVPERIEKSIESFRRSGKLNLANEYSQVWNIVMELFDQTVEVMGDETFGIERFAGMLKIGFDEYKAGLIPAAMDQVLVGSVERSKSHEIKALYILGVNDGVFPAAAADEGILTDKEREQLNTAGVEPASDTKTRSFDEHYLVYRAMTTAGNYLRISWPIADHEGKAMRPSMIISRLRRLFPAIAESSDILASGSPAADVEMISSKQSAFMKMVSALRKKADGKEAGPVWHDVYKWFLADVEWKEKCMAARAAFQYRNLAQQVSRSNVTALYGDPVISSVSRLEKYTACPFAFFIQFGIGAQERRIFRLSPPDVGTFMHSVIEQFSKLVSEGDITWRSFDRDWCNMKVSDIIDDMLIKMQGSVIIESKRYTAMINRLKRVVGRSVWLIAEHIRRSSFNPIEYEVGFGEKEKFPPITIQLESGKKIHLTGRIDRVDALKTEEGTYLRIVDYKSGTKDFRLSDVYYGLQIQLITYLDALWECSGGQQEIPVQPAGMLYFKVDDPIIKGNGRLTEEEVELAIMKQLKMRGLLLADVKLIKEMDNSIEGASLIIPATVNKGDVLGKNTSAATLAQFKQLRKYVRKLLTEMCGEIMKGNVSIRPYKKKGITSCKYCNFVSVCQFDTAMKDNAFKLLYDKDNEEIWNLMEESEKS